MILGERKMGKNLNDFTLEELELELRKRKIKKLEESCPKMIEKGLWDFEHLSSLVYGCVTNVYKKKIGNEESDSFYDVDFDLESSFEEIAREAIKSFYGSDIFDIID